MNTKCLRLFTVFTAVVLFFAASVRASEMDGRIESSAENSYVFKTYLKDDNITIKSKEGVVTLKGTVKEETHIKLAHETAANLPGVVKVNNQLTFKNRFPVKTMDGWIEMQLKALLLFHRDVNAFKTEVDVKDGVVTLKGEAFNLDQKQLTGEYAADITGVKDVKNDMTLANSSAIEPLPGGKAALHVCCLLSQR